MAHRKRFFQFFILIVRVCPRWKGLGQACVLTRAISRSPSRCCRPRSSRICRPGTLRLRCRRPRICPSGRPIFRPPSIIPPRWSWARGSSSSMSRACLFLLLIPRIPQPERKLPGTYATGIRGTPARNGARTKCVTTGGKRNEPRSFISRSSGVCTGRIPLRMWPSGKRQASTLRCTHGCSPRQI